MNIKDFDQTAHMPKGTVSDGDTYILKKLMKLNATRMLESLDHVKLIQPV